MGWRAMFAVMDSRIIDKDGNENPIARLVLLALARHAGDDGSNAHPGRELIARETGLGKGYHSISHALGWLEEKGYIELDRRKRLRDYPGRPATTYRICMERLVPHTAGPAAAPYESEYRAPDAQNGFHAPDAQYHEYDAHGARNDDHFRAPQSQFRARDDEFRAPKPPISCATRTPISEESSQSDDSSEREQNADVRRARGAPPAARNTGTTTATRSAAAVAAEHQRHRDDELEARFEAAEDARLAMLSEEEHDAELEAFQQWRKDWLADLTRRAQQKEQRDGPDAARAYREVQDKRWICAYMRSCYDLAGVPYPSTIRMPEPEPDDADDDDELDEQQQHYAVVTPIHAGSKTPAARKTAAYA